MKYLIGILFFFLCSSFLLESIANPSPSPTELQLVLKKRKLKDFLKSPFAQFFNPSEVGRSKDKNRIKIHYKTGGFKPYIDFYIWINKRKRIVAARLEIDRKWLLQHLAMGLDVEKSFIAEFGADKEFLNPLVNNIWALAIQDSTKTLSNAHLQKSFNTIVGKTMSYEFKHTDGQIIYFANTTVTNKEGFVIVSEFK